MCQCILSKFLPATIIIKGMNGRGVIESGRGGQRHSGL